MGVLINKTIMCKCGKIECSQAVFSPDQGVDAENTTIWPQDGAEEYA